MDNQILMGTEKHGLIINNDKKELVYYDLLSLFEIFHKKAKKQVIKYSNIKKIKLCFGYTSGVRFDSAQITCEIVKKDNQTIDIPITYHNSSIEDLKKCMNLLQNSAMHIEDPYHILTQVLKADDDIISFVKSLY